MAKKIAKQTQNSSSKAKLASVTPRYQTIADNRRARFNYEVLESVEAGIVLTGTEIKSVRAGKANIRDAYGQVRNRELWLHNLHISSYTSAGPWNHEPLRSRKLLLHHYQITRLADQAGQKGLAIIPLRLYIKGHHAKVEMALAKGRRRYDKRKVIMRRETDREIARAMRNRSH